MPDDEDTIRFECILDPCDQWIVWDNVRDEPAIINGHYAIGLTSAEADSILSELNRMSRMAEGPRLAAGRRA